MTTVKSRIVDKLEDQRHAVCFLYAELIEKTLSSKAYDYTTEHLLEELTEKISNKYLSHIDFMAGYSMSPEDLKTFENTIHKLNNGLRINPAKCTEPFSWSRYIAAYPINKYELQSSEQGSKKIDIYVNGDYVCSSNWSRSTELARLRYIAKRMDYLEPGDKVIACISDPK